MSPDDQYNCQSIIAELISENYRKLNVFLLEPNYIDAPNYFSIIERPMDFQTLSANLKNDVYSTVDKFFDDLQLIFDNAVKYNQGTRSQQIADNAKELEKEYIRFKVSYDYYKRGPEIKDKKASSSAVVTGGSDVGINNGSSSSPGMIKEPQQYAYPANYAAQQRQQQDISSVKPTPEAAQLIALSNDTMDAVSALNYIQIIHERFATNSNVCQGFSNIVNEYREGIHCTTIDEMITFVSLLFQDHADLLKGFVHFLPVQYQAQGKVKLDAAAETAVARSAARKAAAVCVLDLTTHGQQSPATAKISAKSDTRHPTASDRELQYPTEPVNSLPEGWVSRTIPRLNTETNSKSGRKVSDVYYYSPKLGYKFRSIPEVRRFLKCLGDVVNGNESLALEEYKKLEEEKKSKKRKARNSPSGKMPSSKKISLKADAKYAAELQRREEQRARESEGMLSTVKGRAYKFVEHVLKELWCLEKAKGDKGIEPVTKDDMVHMTERMLLLIDSDAFRDKDTTVDLGFHFTSEDSMGHIQRDGLMTLSDRESNPKLNPREARRKHGAVFGDGVYTGDVPGEFVNYGPVGIMVARLKGKINRIKPEEIRISTTLAESSSARFRVKAPVGQEAKILSYDTVVGNKTYAPQKPQNDEVVLLRSAQCIPIFRFPSSLVPKNSNGTPRTLMPWRNAMKKVVDSFFNEGKSPRKPASRTSSRAKTFPSSQLASTTRVSSFLPKSSPRRVVATSTKTSRTPPHRSSSTLPVTQEVVRYSAPNTIDDACSDLGMLLETPNESLSSTETCVICFDLLCEKPVLSVKTCKHMFCQNCLLNSLSFNRKCPTCQGSIGEPQGKCPSGEMHISVNQAISCAGHNNFGTIVITYKIPAGRQKVYHETEGKEYTRIQRVAYLPDNDDGRRLARRLRYAFSHGLTFRIGKSVTTGREGQVTWASIHHKTKRNGGAHGWPDLNAFVQYNKDLDNLGVPKACDCS